MSEENKINKEPETAEAGAAETGTAETAAAETGAAEKEKRLFVSNPEAPFWDNIFGSSHLLEQEPGEFTVENGIVLPLRVREDLKRLDAAYEGGVCDSEFVFKAGLRRNYEKEDWNLSVCTSYQVPEEEIVTKDETVVFGGIMQKHFGDMLTMTTARLWWFAQNPDTPYRFVFLFRPGFSVDDYPKEFFELLGLTEDRIEIVTVPTRYSRIIVPEEACYNLSCAHPKWLLPFEYMKEKAKAALPPSPHEKIYLSRTEFSKYGEGDGLNEEFYEEFFRRRGFAVIHPQTLPLIEQVSLLMGAKEIACTFGTLSHMALFAQDGARQINIIRAPEWWPSQSVISAVRHLDWYYVEGTMNPLVSPHDYGYFLYYPTKYFRAFLEAQGIPYTEEEMGEKTPPDELINLYIRKWAEHFTDPYYFRGMKDRTAFDELNAMNIALYGRELDPANYPRPRVYDQYDDCKHVGNVFRICSIYFSTHNLQVLIHNDLGLSSGVVFKFQRIRIAVADLMHIILIAFLANISWNTNGCNARNGVCNSRNNRICYLIGFTQQFLCKVF